MSSLMAGQTARQPARGSATWKAGDGLTAPGMPIGSPGMEIPGVEDEPFDVITFDAERNKEVYAS
jgi:hypothetical protein